MIRDDSQRDEREDSLFGTPLRHTGDMMNPTVIKYKYTMRVWICVHLAKQTVKPEHKIIAIVTPDFDVAIDQAIHGDSWEQRVAKLHSEWL